MPVAKTIFKNTRPTAWPAPEGTTVTVEARIHGDVIGITWVRSDWPDSIHNIALQTAEFNGIAAALRQIGVK